jgi:hypothetical protein
LNRNIENFPFHWSKAKELPYSDMKTALLWKEQFESELLMEHLWCEAKIGNPTSSQVENDYYRGYMQCLDRILKGIQPTEIKRAFEEKLNHGEVNEADLDNGEKK